MRVLSPLVNTKVKMSAEMMTALNMHEAKCVFTKVKTVTEDDVRAFLKERSGQELADAFKPEYLFHTEVV